VAPPLFYKEAVEMTNARCPSAPPDWPQAEIFAIAAGTPEEPTLAFLPKPIPVSDELVQSTAPLDPRQVFRIAAQCQEGGCRHWDGSGCSLVRRVIAQFEPKATDIPPCRIRKLCVWFDQEGLEACRRCVGIPTDIGAGRVEYL
jgi:hypothetical protein